MTEVKKLESNFRNIFASMIKPFNSVIGETNLSLAHNVFDRIKDKYPEVQDIKKKEYQVLFIFKPNTSESKRKEILLTSVKELKKSYEKIAGNIADYMINFALKDYWEKYKLPVNVLK